MNRNERLHELRKSAGFTLKEVSERIGVSEGTIQRYEKGGIKDIPYESVTALADLYGVSPAYIMGWEPEYSKDDLKFIQSLTENDIAYLKAFRTAPKEVKDGILQILGVSK